MEEYIYYLMSEKAIRLDIARVCDHISRATYHTQREFTARTLHILQAMKYEVSNMGNICHAGVWGMLWASIQGI